MPIDSVDKNTELTNIFVLPLSVIDNCMCLTILGYFKLLVLINVFYLTILESLSQYSKYVWKSHQPRDMSVVQSLK